MRRFARTRLAAFALLVFAWPGKAQADLVGPFHLALGGGTSNEGSVGIFDAGVWVGPFLPTFAYRTTIHGEVGDASFKGARIDLGFWPMRWMALHAGGGGGLLVNDGPGGSVHRGALLAGTTITFAYPERINLFGFGVELMVPLIPSPIDSVQPTPFVMATVTIQPLVLLALFAMMKG